VTSVAPGGPAAAAGLRPGDVIRKVGSRTVDDIDGFRGALTVERSGDGLRLLVERGSSRQFVFLTPDRE
jgi:putative serine protease PepD